MPRGLETLPKTENWGYPELGFGFDFSELAYVDEPEDRLSWVVDECLYGLAMAAYYDLPPEAPQQPNYQPTARKLRRYNKFFGQTVTSLPHHGLPPQTEARQDVIDIDAAVEQVLDELSEENHPVAQMAAQLYCDYGAELGKPLVECAIIEVVKLTHWPMLRTVLAAQVDAWRQGRQF